MNDVAASNERSSEFDINGLAEISGQSVRNLRAYLQLGVLQPGIKKGRSLFFDRSHQRRLRDIARLRERGYSLAAIRDVMSGATTDGALGEDVDAIDRLVGRWLCDESEPMLAPAEIGLLFAQRQDDEQAIDIDLVESQVQRLLEDGIDVSRPELLRAAVRLARHGVPLTDALREFEEFGQVIQPVIDHLELVGRQWTIGDEVDPEQLRVLWPSLLLAISSHLTVRFFEQLVVNSPNPSTVT